MVYSVHFRLLVYFSSAGLVRLFFVCSPLACFADLSSTGLFFACWSGKWQGPYSSARPFCRFFAHWPPWLPFTFYRRPALWPHYHPEATSRRLADLALAVITTRNAAMSSRTMKRFRSLAPPGTKRNAGGTCERLRQRPGPRLPKRLRIRDAWRDTRRRPL